ncbi:MAG TPA: nicotinate (nicotinamide) nucleotide adenylyltransferase [Chitinophagaceae bacterium]|nr:nicotinate (nicotinamide) nucleotide adenylyltransferase [Chitinophagaceae bacterium]
MRIGLYFGSFNPIHIGHLIIANHVLNHCDLDRIWFVVSPHNPLKESASLLNESHRMHLVQLAIENESKFKASNVEFKLPRPSFTIDTMTHLTEKYPEHSFSIIMGSDSFQNIKKWKNYTALLQQFQIIIYNRPNSTIDLSLSNKLQVVDAPLLDISSTYIRNLIKERKSIRYLVTDEVMNDIKANGYYRS